MLLLSYECQRLAALLNFSFSKPRLKSHLEFCTEKITRSNAFHYYVHHSTTLVFFFLIFFSVFLRRFMHLKILFSAFKLETLSKKKIANVQQNNSHSNGNCKQQLQVKIFLTCNESKSKVNACRIKLHTCVRICCNCNCMAYIVSKKKKKFFFLFDVVKPTTNADDNDTTTTTTTTITLSQQYLQRPL